jgi:hypothetical protein
MTPREYPTHKWLVKGRWAFVWRTAALFAGIMMALWIIGVGLTHLGLDSPAWNWVLPHPLAITVTILLEHLGKFAMIGFLYGWFMSYQVRPPNGSKPAV